MTAIGGSIEGVTIAGRPFAVAADADSNRKLGGFENEVQANGDGTARMVKTRMPWQIDGLALEIDDSRDDQQFLRDVANDNGFVPMDITFASGAVFQGTGNVVGEIARASQNATAPITLSGPGNLSRQ